MKTKLASLLLTAVATALFAQVPPPAAPLAEAARCAALVDAALRARGF